MIVDKTSLFFNSTIKGKTATAAWGTSVGQSKIKENRLEINTPGVTDIISGMIYKSEQVSSGFDLSKMSKSREVILSSIFDKVRINGILLKDVSFIMFLVREHSQSHDGRLILSYPPYATFRDGNRIISNQYALGLMRKAIGCGENGCWFVYDISVFNQDELNFSAVVVDKDFHQEYLSSQERSALWNQLASNTNENYVEPCVQTSDSNNEALQQIFYGAPGTGKSHCVKYETNVWEKKGRVVRTTFHPDSDYSTFVGAYKPTTESVQRYDIYNKPITRDGVPVMEQIITYDFVPQAFLQAYIDAWKNREEPEYLIIEEINRGNCAQIFGDLFQLLDRGDDGYSEYAVRADKDLQKHLCKALADAEIEDYPKVKSGEELILPKNLYIRATMNTSDQSLFPIDSAFKRRWDWKYVPIAKGNDNGAELNWIIDVNDTKYDWWTFIKIINKHVFETTNSEDKQLGFFFCKAKDNVINAETFVGKVIFYLWNDVFKDFGFDNPIFADKEDAANPKLSFDKFYLPNGEVNMETVNKFLANLGIAPFEDAISEYLDEDGNSEGTTKKDFSKYSVNGIGAFSKGKVVQQAVETYAKEHPEMSAEQMVNQWMGLGVNVPNFIETKATYDSRVKLSKDARVQQKAKSVILPQGDMVYVSNQYNPERIADFVSKLNAAGWNIKIEKV